MSAATSDVSQTFPVPTYNELMREFNWVSDGFKPGEATDWQLHDSCKGVVPADPKTCELVHFARSMSMPAVLDELKSRGLRPATFNELLAYARKYPDEQREFAIVALGVSCIWHGGRVPFLDWGIEQGLHLAWDECVWSDSSRFLAVRA